MCGAETHLLFTDHSAVDASDTSASHACQSERWPASPKGRVESEPRGPSQVRGVRWGRTNRTVPVTNRHDSPWFENVRSHFALFWLFWLARGTCAGWSSEKKCHFESGLNQRDGAKGAISRMYPPAEARTHPAARGAAGCRGAPVPDVPVRRTRIAPPHPRTRNVFFVIIFFAGTSTDQKNWNSHQPRLGVTPLAQFRGPIARFGASSIPGPLLLGR